MIYQTYFVIQVKRYFFYLAFKWMLKSSSNVHTKHAYKITTVFVNSKLKLTRKIKKFWPTSCVEFQNIFVRWIIYYRKSWNDIHLQIRYNIYRPLISLEIRSSCSSVYVIYVEYSKQHKLPQQIQFKKTNSNRSYESTNVKSSK